MKTVTFLKRGDNRIEIGDYQYMIDDFDSNVTGNVKQITQEDNGILHIDTITINPLPEKLEDTNVKKYRFIPRKSITEKVVGTSFRFKEQGNKSYYDFDGVESNEDGVPVIHGYAVLVPEPTNPYDSNAVMVIAKLKDGSAYHLGYLGKGSELQKKIKTNTLSELIIKGYSEVGSYNDSYEISVSES